MSTLLDIVTTVTDFLTTMTTSIGLDIIFIVALVVEAILVVFFLVKSAFSYEAALNRSLDKFNIWLFDKKIINEDNIREFNATMKTRGPKRLCYYWQQYILFREGDPSSYMSADNLVEKPLKTSSYNSNIKNLNVLSTVWAIIVMLLMVVAVPSSNDMLTVSAVAGGIFVVALIFVINLVFTIYLRARKNSLLNSIYQSVGLFGRFMDNACVNLTPYIDYQILFTPAEIEKGQPVLREFLDYKSRKEISDFNRAKEEEVNYEVYDFSSTGVNGSVVLERAMKESEAYLGKKEKILVKIAQLESELDTRKKNFDNVQKDYQTKLQTSRENIDKLLQQQEETTNRIESNYLRKQQTQEIAKQEQLEQEFEQQRAKYLLEKKECEEEIKQNKDTLEQHRLAVEKAMLGEYQSFFNSFCQSAEKVVNAVVGEKMDKLKKENADAQEQITALEIQLKNVHSGAYDANAPLENTTQETPNDGKYDDNGNFVYANGSYYSPDGLFHDVDGKIYTADGTYVGEEAPAAQTATTEELQEVKVDLNDLDAFEFMTDVDIKNDVYDVAKNVIKSVDSDIEVTNSGKIEEPKAEEVKEEVKEEPKPVEEEKPAVDDLETFNLDDFGELEPIETKQEPKEEQAKPTEEVVEEKAEEPEKPKKKAGRPRKIVKEEETPKKSVGRPRKAEPVEQEPKKKAGRPKKVTTETEKPKGKPGRPKKVEETPVEKKSVGRPRKIVKEEEETPKKKPGRPKKETTETETPKRKPGRPKKTSLEELNKKIMEQEDKLNEMRNSLNKEFEIAIKNLEEQKTTDDAKRREELLKEIESLQEEAKNTSTDDLDTILEINRKLEQAIKEIKNLND